MHVVSELLYLVRSRSACCIRRVTFTGAKKDIAAIVKRKTGRKVRGMEHCLRSSSQITDQSISLFLLSVP
jgi:hypothetical protein